jgi:hypothetical protein
MKLVCLLEKNVDNYISGLEPWKAQIVSRLRSIILEVAPQAKESIKWAQPVYETNGPFCYIKAFKNSVNLGFWRGVDIKDPHGLLQGSGEKMRHIKLTSVNDIDQKVFTDFISQAVQLNLNKGDPTKNK